MYRVQKVSRGNKKLRNHYAGSIFDSGFEADYCRRLDRLVDKGEILDYDKQYTVRIEANGMFICNWKIDYRIHKLDGSFDLIEVKGIEGQLYTFKLRLLEALWLPEHLDHELLIIKEKTWRR